MRLSGTTTSRISSRLRVAQPARAPVESLSRIREHMDKIPIHKLRRKPKPPAIETARERSSSPATNNTIHLAPEDAAASRGSKSPKFPSRMSPFRRLRGGKRARSCSPAASQLGGPVAAVVSNGGKATNGQSEEPRLKIPAFLMQSDYGAV